MMNLPMGPMDMLGGLDEILTLPEKQLEIVLNELEDQLEEMLGNEEAIKNTKRQLLAENTTLESFIEDLEGLKAFKEDTAAKREFDNAQQERLFAFLISYLERLLEDFEKKGLLIPVKVDISLLEVDSKKPEYQRLGDAGCDAYVSETVIIPAGKTKLVPLGISLAIPVGYEVQMRLRSSISLKTPLRLANGIGTIDAGYRDQLYAIIDNISSADFEVEKGTRLVQLVLSKVEQIEWEVVEDVKNIGKNRGGGLGSTDAEKQGE